MQKTCNVHHQESNWPMSTTKNSEMTFPKVRSTHAWPAGAPGGGGGGGGGWCPCNSSQGFPVDNLVGWSQQARGGGRSCSVECPGIGALQASRANQRSEAHRGHHVKPPIASGMVHTRSSTSAPAKLGLSGRHSHGLVVPLEKEPESTTEVGATCCAACSLWDGESKIMLLPAVVAGLSA